MSFAESYVLVSSVVAFLLLAGSLLPTPVESLFRNER